ncbi:hypothetical protein Tco_0873499 [Tanacetum coccineum]|uniref:Uncharacterized protein n=1 Tax=Tanacetum coccineum TaxID=301880 RepID=A0ABQ5BMJ6_9ASTR
MLKTATDSRLSQEEAIPRASGPKSDRNIVHRDVPKFSKFRHSEACAEEFRDTVRRFASFVVRMIWKREKVEAFGAYRRAIIKELEGLPGNLVVYKMREILKRIQKTVLVEAIELKKELRL